MGHVKNLFSVFLGLFLLGGIKLTFINALGLLVNSSGGIWYSVIKYRESKQKHRNAMQHDAMEKGKLHDNADTAPDGEMKDSHLSSSNNHSNTEHSEHFLVSPDKGRVSVT